MRAPREQSVHRTHRRNGAARAGGPVPDQRHRFGGTRRANSGRRGAGLDLTGLITAATRPVTAAEAVRLEELACRRLKGEPVARILGAKEFWGLPLQVSAATLVPRPDTETVVELALEMLRAAPAPDRPLRIADIGTGSGAILLALLSALPDAYGIGTD